MSAARTRAMDGRVVVVTGASAGVGRATATRFARAGARVGLIARGKKSLSALQSELRDSGAQVMAASAGVRRRASSAGRGA